MWLVGCLMEISHLDWNPGRNLRSIIQPEWVPLALQQSLKQAKFCCFDGFLKDMSSHAQQFFKCLMARQLRRALLLGVCDGQASFVNGNINAPFERWPHYALLLYWLFPINGMLLSCFFCFVYSCFGGCIEVMKQVRSVVTSKWGNKKKRHNKGTSVESRWRTIGWTQNTATNGTVPLWS